MTKKKAPKKPNKYHKLIKLDSPPASFDEALLLTTKKPPKKNS